MNQWKSELTCSYCAKIFKDPILLPGNHSICRDHLKRETWSKRTKSNATNVIKSFKPNEEFSDYVECVFHLTEKEISLYQDLEVSVRRFFEFYDEFQQN